MIFLRLFWEFFKVGLFSIGGGMATLPFLYDLGERSGWFTMAEVADMLAVSESTPGPIGVNMATMWAFAAAGFRRRGGYFGARGAQHPGDPSDCPGAGEVSGQPVCERGVLHAAPGLRRR